MFTMFGVVLLIVSLYSALRIAVYAIASNFQSIKQVHHTVRFKSEYYRPTVSVIVPAHNEGAVIERTLDSLLASNYPRSRIEVIVANDGSTDDTSKRVRYYAARHRKQMKIRLVTRSNRGKAEALNYAIKNRATGRLIMCLDADSIVHPDCIKNSVQYFRDKRVMATASNVNIIENGTLLGLAQRFEYLYSHHFKKAHTLMNMEYIIGGVGSTFRKSTLKNVAFYDSNTMTEDIDLTMKIIKLGNIDNRVIFAPDAITYTEPVLSYDGLINQRFRWKYGRLQSFYKNKELFFATNRKYSKQLTWFLLPMTILYEISMLLEPFIIAYVLYLCFYLGGISTLLFSALAFTVILVLNTWSSDHVDVKDKTRLTVYAPAMYVILYVLTIIEYVVVIRSLSKLWNLPASLRSGKTTWQSPVRNPSAAL